jgi:predicted esterase
MSATRNPSDLSDPHDPSDLSDPNDPHAGGRLLHAGAPLGEAEGAVILLHGRGGSADDILSLKAALDEGLAGRKIAWLAPEANGRTWYPNSFLAPREVNEPYLSSALRRVDSLVRAVAKAGLGPEKIVIGGFSQGACLSTEFIASHPARYAGLIAWTGGLVGPLGARLEHAGDLGGMPALLLSGDPDPHVPWRRVEESAEVLTRMGAKVALRRYPGRPHTVSGDELRLARESIERAFLQQAGSFDSALTMLGQRA